MEEINWTQEQLLEVGLDEPDDFLKVRETLSRIGVPEKKGSCISPVIFYTKQGRYYVVHFKELFALDGKQTNISVNDLSRRNTIANLLQDCSGKNHERESL